MLGLCANNKTCAPCWFSGGESLNVVDDGHWESQLINLYISKLPKLLTQPTTHKLGYIHKICLKTCDMRMLIWMAKWFFSISKLSEIRDMVFCVFHHHLKSMWRMCSQVFYINCKDLISSGKKIFLG
jgi:hypothetical protein